MSNFDFLTGKYEALKEIGKSAEDLVYQDPTSAIGKIRLLAEKIAEIVMNIEGIILNEDKQILRLNYLEDNDVISDKILQVFHSIRKIGNNAIHEGRYNDPKSAMTVIKLGYYISCCS